MRFRLGILCAIAAAACGHGVTVGADPHAKAVAALALASVPAPAERATPTAAPAPKAKGCACVPGEDCLCPKGGCDCEPSRAVADVKDVPDPHKGMKNDGGYCWYRSPTGNLALFPPTRKAPEGWVNIGSEAEWNLKHERGEVKSPGGWDCSSGVCRPASSNAVYGSSGMVYGGSCAGGSCGTSYGGSYGSFSPAYGFGAGGSSGGCSGGSCGSPAAGGFRRR